MLTRSSPLAILIRRPARFLTNPLLTFIYILFLVFVAVLGSAAVLHKSIGVDYLETFRPATKMVLRGHSPYKYIYSPPWVILPLLPLAILPEGISPYIWLGISIVAFLWAIIRLGAQWFTALIVLLSPPVLFSLISGNIEFLVILGFTLPSPVSRFLVLLKPHVGWTVALF